MNFQLKKSKVTVNYKGKTYLFYRTKNIKILKKIWNRIVDSSEGNIYLTYQYNLYCSKLFSIQNALHKIVKRSRKHLMFIYGVSEDKNVLIFPGIVDKKRKTISFLGEQYSTGAGYNDIIGNSDADMWSAFIKYLNFQYRKINGEYVLSLHDIFNQSVICQKLKERPCVKILIKNESENLYDSWYNSLSKNSRQNLRTAYNRMKTDNKDFYIEIYDKLSFKKKIRIFQLIANRSNQINHIENNDTNAKFSEHIKSVYKMLMSISFYMFKHSKRSQIVVLMINDNLASCMITYSEKSGVVVPKLAIDTDFSRYSPGCIMISEYIKNINQGKSYFVLDMSRGDEKYKLSLGGEVYWNYGCNIILNETGRTDGKNKCDSTCI